MWEVGGGRGARQFFFIYMLSLVMSSLRPANRTLVKHRGTTESFVTGGGCLCGSLWSI